ncbi:hypothetical protein [Nitrosomonas supralitoralis]|uniref:Uncharacterized protein n=1 Tax=Nitrosomonas supralitoralis TaxID=2116706 RepID=A0A2P7NZN7_9PROT|nr:hypothetical protein [Nitrosomonas supralitoralis]PSJ18907.1 hypothetical protein C7H79_00265 [Nitrosomonas supralitoralis]
MSTYKILLALLGAPSAWFIQMSLSEPLAAYACYPHQVPLTAPLWVDLSAILIAISLICLAGGLISGYVAWDSWRKLTKSGSNGKIFVVDEGQTQFLAMLGVMSSFIFIAAIVFTFCAVLLVSPCSAWT